MKLTVLAGVVLAAAVTAGVAAQSGSTTTEQTIMGCVKGDGSDANPWMLVGVVIPPPPPPPPAGPPGGGGRGGRGGGPPAAGGGRPPGPPRPTARPHPQRPAHHQRPALHRPGEHRRQGPRAAVEAVARHRQLPHRRLHLHRISS